MDTRLIRGEFMRKVLFSPVTKVVAFILAVACLVLAANSTVDTYVRYMGEEEQIYGFETKFEYTSNSYFYWILREPVDAIYYGWNVFDGDESGKSFEEFVAEQLEIMEDRDKIEYRVLYKDQVFTNSNKTDIEEFEKERFSFIFSKSNDAWEYYHTDWAKYINAEENLDIWVSVKDSYVQECEIKWQEQSDYIWDGITASLVFIGLALILIIHLISTVGKKADGEKKMIWLDVIWTEVHLAIVAILVYTAPYLLVVAFEDYWRFDYAWTPELFKGTVLVIVGASGALIINSLLSLVRKIKCRKFLKTSIIILILKFMYKVVEKIFNSGAEVTKKGGRLFYSLLTKKSGLLLTLVMFVYTVLMAICGACLTDDDTAFIGIAFGLILFAFVCFVFAYRARELDSIKKGVKEVKSGNMTYNIPTLRSSDLNALAQDINEIAFGLDQSVSAKVRAERMKTELITNVSHDLKTPLTSIISYTELLNNVEGLPEEAQDYAQIIAKKSDRLKRLTQDLFDISKIQSGNEEITIERIDISLLVAQSLGEHDGEIKKSELNFCVNLEKELYICADGRKMSRVISNLMSNVLKYAMKNTRVFVTASTQGNNAVVEIKNTSAYPMDFDAQEIMGRFVRGDKSRSVEGNGLGLAIVHSYTQACGGKFEIVTDGDLFKAIISFPTIK